MIDLRLFESYYYKIIHYTSDFHIILQKKIESKYFEVGLLIVRWRKCWINALEYAVKMFEGYIFQKKMINFEESVIWKWEWYGFVKTYIFQFALWMTTLILMHLGLKWRIPHELYIFKEKTSITYIEKFNHTLVSKKMAE